MTRRQDAWTDRVNIKHTESGCWAVRHGEEVIDIYPSHMWVQAYREALRTAIYQNLSVLRIEINT